MVVSFRGYLLLFSGFSSVIFTFFFAFTVFYLIWINGSIAPAGKDLLQHLKTNHSFAHKMRLRNQIYAETSSFHLGPFGSTMVDMMGIDLPFTLFVPSEPFLQNLFSQQTIALNGTKQTLFASAFNFSQAPGAAQDEVHAVLSRILGFSAVPKRVCPEAVPLGGELELGSISGHKLYLSKDVERGLLINNLAWEASDFTRGQLMVHLVDGVLMDYEFERSIIVERFVKEEI